MVHLPHHYNLDIHQVISSEPLVVATVCGEGYHQQRHKSANQAMLYTHK